MQNLAEDNLLRLATTFVTASNFKVTNHDEQCINTKRFPFLKNRVAVCAHLTLSLVLTFHWLSSSLR